MDKLCLLVIISSLIELTSVFIQKEISNSPIYQLIIDKKGYVITYFKPTDGYQYYTGKKKKKGVKR